MPPSAADTPPGLPAGLPPLAEVFEHVGAGMAVVGADGRLLRANPALARMLGYDREALEALPIEAVTHPDDWPEDVARFRALLDGHGDRYTLDKRFLRADGTTMWGALTVTLVRGTDGAPRYAVSVVQDITEPRRRAAERELLSEASRVLASSLDHETTLRTVARLAVPGVADWCAVDLRGDGVAVRRVAVEHTDPERRALATRIHTDYPPRPEDDGPLWTVLRTGEPVLLRDVDDAVLAAHARDATHLALLRRLGMRSALVVPLRARDVVVGALTLVQGESGRRFDDEGVAFATELARRAAMAIENARLHHTAVEARRAAERQAVELEVQAATLQARSAELEAARAEGEAVVRELWRANEALAATARAEEEARRAAERAADRVARLQRVTAALSGAVHPARVAEAVVAHGMRALGAEAATVALLDAAGETLEIVRAAGLPESVARAYHRFSLAADLPAARAARTGAPAYERRDGASWVAGLDAIPGGDAVRQAAWLSLPLTVEGRVLGALTLGFAAAPDPFPAEDLAFAAALAQQCAQALERARLYEAEARARADAERAATWSGVLERVTSLLASSLDYRHTVHGIGDLVVPWLADHLQIYLLTGNALARVATACADPVRAALLEELHARAPLTLDGESPQAEVVRTGAPKLILGADDAFFRRVAEDEDHYRLLAGIGSRCILIVPLVARGAVVGALGLGRFEGRAPFTTDDVAMAEVLAGRVALGVDNGRLYEAEQRARAEAEAASRAKSDFLAVMSHELRTPLNAILGYLDLLDAGVAGALAPQQRDYVARVTASGRHLLGLIEEVLTFSRIEAGREAVHLEPADAGAVARQAAELVEPLARKRGLDFAVAAPDALPLRTDAGKLRQILVNLLGNAVKFTDAGRVALAVEEDAAAGTVRFTVADTGMGIPREAVARIFEPFWQVSQGRTRPAGGTGLGLAVARDLARMLGGDVTVESEPGRGSTFRVEVPRAGPGA